MGSSALPRPETSWSLSLAGNIGFLQIPQVPPAALAFRWWRGVGGNSWLFRTLADLPPGDLGQFPVHTSSQRRQRSGTWRPGTPAVPFGGCEGSGVQRSGGWAPVSTSDQPRDLVPVTAVTSSENEGSEGHAVGSREMRCFSVPRWGTVSRARCPHRRRWPWAEVSRGGRVARVP